MAHLLSWSKEMILSKVTVHLFFSGLSSLKFLSKLNLKWAHVLSQTAHLVVWHNNYSDRAHCILNANFSSWFACCWVQCCTVWHWSNLCTLYGRFLHIAAGNRLHQTSDWMLTWRLGSLWFQWRQCKYVSNNPSCEESIHWAYGCDWWRLLKLWHCKKCKAVPFDIRSSTCFPASTAGR